MFGVQVYKGAFQGLSAWLRGRFGFRVSGFRVERSGV